MVPVSDTVTVAQPPSTGLAALRDMRSARRHRRVQETEWFEALYRVYLAAIVIGGSVLFISGVFEDAVATTNDISHITEHGPNILGLVVAIALFLGVRSGASGGPIAVEDAEVRHVLLAPLDIRAALRKPAIQRLRSAAFAGALAGAAAGQLAARRLPGSLGAWAFYGAVYGACVGLVWVGAALIVHGLRLPNTLITLVASALVFWQAAVTVGDTNAPGPFDAFGSMALWSLHIEAIDLIAVGITAITATVGIFLVGTLSLEALARRSNLVAQLRFAVTLQDIRTVMLLRRQLSQEQMRATPWLTLKRRGTLPPIARRGVQSFLKFPARRYARMKLMVVLAALAQVAAYRGTTPAVVASGLCLFVFGLELVEPLSQEVDKPERTDSLPIDRGALMLRHLVVPAVMLIPFSIVAIITAVVFERDGAAVATASLLAPFALATGMAGAVINAVKGAPDPLGDNAKSLFMPPEVAGMTTMTRAVLPIIIATLGSLPVIAVREAVESGSHPVGTAVRTCVGVALLLLLVVGWVRQRDAIRRWWKKSVEESQQHKRKTSVST
jgi:hypothetical protein